MPSRPPPGPGGRPPVPGRPQPGRIEDRRVPGSAAPGTTEDRPAAGPARGIEDRRVPGWAAPGTTEDRPAADPARGTIEDRRVPGWAAPGTTEDQPAADPARGTIEDRPGPGWAVPRVALRPMTAADILDGGFAVIKARPARIFGVAAGFVVPVHLLLAFLQRRASGGLGLADLLWADPAVVDQQATAGDPAVDLLTFLAGALLPAAALVFVAAAIAHLVSQWITGRDAPAGEMLGLAGRRWWPLLGSFVIVKLAEVVGLFGCYIGIVFVMALFVPVAPIIGVEGGGPLRAVARSVRLTRGRYFRTLGIAVLMGLVATMVGYALAALPQGLALWVGMDDGWPLAALGATVSQVVVLPFVAAATVLLYFDLRVRTEGLDLELAARDVLGTGA